MRKKASTAYPTRICALSSWSAMASMLRLSSDRKITYRIDVMGEMGLYSDAQKGINRVSDPHLRIELMERDGIDAEVIFRSEENLPHRRDGRDGPVFGCAKRHQPRIRPASAH